MAAPQILVGLREGICGVTLSSDMDNLFCKLLFLTGGPKVSLIVLPLLGPVFELVP